MRISPDKIETACWSLENIDWEDSSVEFRLYVIDESDPVRYTPNWCASDLSDRSFDGMHKNVLVSTRDLFECFKLKNTKSIPSNQDMEAFVANPKSTIIKNNGGRNPKYDWEGFYVEIAVLGDLDALPSTQSELIETMSDWCESAWGEIPSASMLKEKVSRIYNHSRKSANN